jgi:hypothetical protein
MGKPGKESRTDVGRRARMRLCAGSKGYETRTFQVIMNTTGKLGRAMAAAVDHRPLTAEARVRSRVSPCGICGGQSGTGTSFSPSTSVFPCQFYSTGVPFLGKMKKLIFLITGLHNKPQGCGASVSSAAGPFTTTTTTYVNYSH